MSNIVTEHAARRLPCGWYAVEDTRTPEEKAKQEEEWRRDKKEERLCELLTPEPWPMTTDEVEERRQQIEAIVGPFPRCSREELWRDEVKDLDAMRDWDLMDALHRGSAPDILYLCGQIR